jgi:hypothetical protein
VLAFLSLAGCSLGSVVAGPHGCASLAGLLRGDLRRFLAAH